MIAQNICGGPRIATDKPPQFTPAYRVPLLFRQACELENRPLQAGFERLIAMDGHDDQRTFTRFAIDVVTLPDPLQLPAVCLKQLAAFLAAVGLDAHPG